MLFEGEVVMLNKAFSKKKKWITGAIAGTLAVTIVTTGIYQSRGEALAKASLPKIEEYNQENSLTNPFTILEIVPSYNEAKIGYLVNGQEPAYYDDEVGVKALADMGSSAERKDRYTTTVDSFEYANHDFSVFNDLKDVAFSYSNYIETDPADPELMTKKFTTYGEFKEVVSGKGDYVDNSKDEATYEEVAPNASTGTGITIADVLRLTDEHTQHSLYSDDVTFEFSSSVLTDGYDLIFKEYSYATSVERIPFKITLDSDFDSATPSETLYNWFYYMKDAAITATRDTDSYSDPENPPANSATKRYDIAYEFPASGVTALYEKFNGDSYRYIGYVYADTNGVFWYKSVDGSAKVLEGEDVDADNNAQSTFAEDVYENSKEIYTIRYYSDLNDSERQSERLYVTNAAVNETSTAVVSANVMKKTLRISAGDNPSDRFIVLDDPLTYHKFFYLPADTDEYVYDMTGGVHDRSKGEVDFVSSYASPLAETFSYGGGFDNNEWFKQYVLDLVQNKTDATADECANNVVDVVTKLPKNVSVADIENADFIYIQGGDYTATDDISKDVAVALIASLGSSVNKPVAVEGNELYGGTSTLQNLNNLAIVLEQGSLTDEAIAEYIAAWNDDPASIATKYGASRIAEAGKSYTNRTVFVFNGDKNVTGSSIVCKDFAKALSGEDIKDSDDKYVAGYAEVRTDIEKEQFYLNVAESKAEFNSTISIATCIRHIINYGNRRVASKDTLRVLDIEPFFSPVVEASPETLFGTKFTYKNGTNFTSINDVVYDANSRDIITKKWIMDNIGTQITDADKINIKGMGTREFVSNILDLNENYDLIYIGLDTQYLNTEIESKTTTVGQDTKTVHVKTNKTVYNNSDLNGLVYTHIGDTFVGEENNGTEIMATPGTYKGSGNDITFEKTRELQAYVEAGYSLIFSDEFFSYNDAGKITGVNNKTVDSKSYMYDFAKWVIDKGYIGKNVSVKKNFIDVQGAKTTTGDTVVECREEFAKYLSISKLNIEVIEKPIEYYINVDNTNNSTNEEDYDYHYLNVNRDGFYTLDFKVKLTNDAAVDTSNTSYDCKLYIDHDADGRYADIEALNGLIIADSNGNPASFDDTTGRFNLTTGKTYTITRRVPDGYVGFLPWKLVFFENNRAFANTDTSTATNLIRTAVEGYSAVPPETVDRPVIKVLQITSGDSKTTNLDLEDDNNMKKLYNEVRDFEIKVTKITCSDYVKNPNNKLYTGDPLDYLMNYDMVVMGFIDMYKFTSDADKSLRAMYAIRQYILSGRSMLFTHDLNSTSMSANEWGYLANTYLRDVQGMDRYGVTTSHLKTMTDAYGAFVSDYKSRYDNDVYPDIFGNTSNKSTTSDGNLIDAYGWNTSTLMRYHFKKGTNSTDEPNGYGDISIAEYNGLQHDSEYVSKYVSRTNKGQITEYPFHIPEQITVANTHPQYFQLDFDTDTKDANYNDDIVVWYTISNQNKNAYASNNNMDKVNYYTYDYNDGRNNYYIYNKGNITYTGAGHSAVTGDDERKLFVNTLVAAYNAGDHAPIAKFRQYPREMAADVTSVYEPFDVNLRNSAGDETGGYIEDNISVYFKTVNNNLQNNAVVDTGTGIITYKPIHAEYYVEAKEGEEGAIKIGNDFYRIIVPTSLKRNVNSNGVELTGDAQNVTSMYSLDNYSIYTAQFNLDDLLPPSTNVDGTLYLKEHNVKIYIRLSVETPTVDTTENNVTKLGMNHNLDVLPGTDSLNELSVNFTELYELR